MELAERLGMTRVELESRMGVGELAEWAALDERRAAERKRAEEKAKRRRR